MSSNTTDLTGVLRYACNAFGCHHPLEITHDLAVMTDGRDLADYPFRASEPDCSAMVDRAIKALNRRCHAVGAQPV